MLFLEHFKYKKGHSQEMRRRSMALHGWIVDEVLRLTAGDRLGLPDGFAIRFEVMLLVTSMVLHVWREDGEFSQALWDITFEGFEQSLRQRGVNDIRIGTKMGILLQNAMGRRKAYQTALKQENRESLTQAVVRNVFGGTVTDRERIEELMASVSGLPERLLEFQSSIVDSERKQT